MDNAWRMIKDLVSELTSVVIGLAGLGIVAAIVFGGPVFGLDVIGGVTDLVEMLSSNGCLLYTSPSPRDGLLSRMPSSA